MSYGAPLSVTLPTVSVTAGPTYATNVNDFLSALQAVVEQKVTPAGFDVNTDFSFLSGGVNYSATELKSTKYAVQTAALSATTYPAALYFSGTDGNLYANDALGNQIQVTAAGAVNVSTSGGITGSGYGSSGVEVNWDSGNTAFRMRSGSATDDFADVVLGAAKFNDGSGNYATLAAPSLASDLTFTLPSAYAGGGGYLVTMDGSGNMGTTNTPTVSTLTVSSTSSFSGKPTFSTEYAHPQRVLHVNPMSMGAPSATLDYTSSNVHWTLGANGQAVFFAIPLYEGQRLEQVVVWVSASATAGNRVVDIGYWNDTVGTWTYPGTAAYEVTVTTTSSRYAITLNNTDITLANPSGSGTQVGFLIGRFVGRISDEVFGARLLYSHT